MSSLLTQTLHPQRQERPATPTVLLGISQQHLLRGCVGARDVHTAQARKLEALSFALPGLMIKCFKRLWGYLEKTVYISCCAVGGEWEGGSNFLLFKLSLPLA